MSIVRKNLCTICGSEYHYQTFCPMKKNKPITKRGKRTLEYEAFRDTVAKPYLDKRYGHICYKCGSPDNLDVHHKQKRGSHVTEKMNVVNLIYLCRSCHNKEHDKKGIAIS
jgi:5-methylcytosine-specific restriction endonuclease McrA